MIAKGANVPDFSLKDKDGETHNLVEVKSKYTVLFFYPKDNTPGCSIEAKRFSDALTQFKKLGVTIFGISGGDEKSKASFCKKLDLKVNLLSDTDFKVSSKYGVYGDKNFMGRNYKGIFRKSYLLDANKKVLKTYEKVKAFAHVDEVLSDIKELEGEK